MVTGGSGQLAGALARARPAWLHPAGLRVVGRPAFDFDRPETMLPTLQAVRPSVVVNAAAWTAVDAAETEQAAADRANHLGPALLARHCRALGAALVHVSTDYVFDGLKGAPYGEADLPSPTGVYGITKLAGERAVLAAHPDAVVLRTSWVYARAGRNFVRTMLNAASRAPVLRVVADQVGCPTNADDLAEAVLGVSRALCGGGRGLGGVYHAAGQGAVSWHGFAQAIFAEAGRHGWPQPDLQAITTAYWPTAARRPPDSRLDCTRLHETFGLRLPAWEQSLRPAVAAMCAPAPADACAP